MKTQTMVLSAAMSLLLAFSSNAGAHDSNSVSAEVRKDMADARAEVRAELAQARRELETENLSLGDSLRFGEKSNRKRSQLPEAEITPEGDFLIEGRAQDISISQRRQLLTYRGQVLEIARIGIDIGERSAEAALDAVGNGSIFGMMFGAMTGSLERKIERLVNEEVGPAVHSICRQLPRVMASQQQLAPNLPKFRPYATLEADDIEDCDNDVRDAFASR